MGDFLALIGIKDTLNNNEDAQKQVGTAQVCYHHRKNHQDSVIIFNYYIYFYSFNCLEKIWPRLNLESRQINVQETSRILTAG